MTTIEAARLEIETEYLADDFETRGVFEQFEGARDLRPWVVSYSGGKDSTLLLSLVLQSIEKHGSRRPVYVVFMDTGIEQDGISERIAANFDGVKNWALERACDVRPKIITPPREWSFFNVIIGRGYTTPYFPLRWCTSALKKDVVNDWHSREFGARPFVSVTGERKAESVARLHRLEKNNPTNASVYQSYDCRKNERRWQPLRDVANDELWRELERQETFPWGEKIDSLLEQYAASSVDEILAEPRDRRSGCRFCTASRGANAGTNDAEREFCAWIVKYSKDINKRNLCCQSRLDFYRNNIKRNLYAQEGGVGKFTIEARREILERVRKMERETGRVWITPEDESFIYAQWEFDKGRIERRELIDAREICSEDGKFVPFIETTPSLLPMFNEAKE